MGGGDELVASIRLWVRTGDMGNGLYRGIGYTFGRKGLSPGSTRSSSWSKLPPTAELKYSNLKRRLLDRVGENEIGRGNACHANSRCFNAPTHERVPVKVLVLNHFPLQGSGSGIYTLNVARELLKAGHEPLVIAPDHYPVEGYPFPVRTMIFSDGDNEQPALNFNFPCFTTHPRSTTTFYELSDDQIASYVDIWQQSVTEAINDFRPDIIHAQHVWVASYIAHLTAIPYVISCHGTDLMGFRKGPRYRDMALAAARNAHAVIAISRQVMADAMELLEQPRAKFRLIWNGFDSECFRVLPDVGKESVLREFDLTGDNAPLVSFVGKFTNFKGIDVLLKAAVTYESDIPGVRTVLVGDGELRDELRALSTTLGLRGIHFLGHQSQPTVARIYNVADVSVVPSREEPFGLVAVEALACGTPVVATDAGGLPDFIDEDVGQLVPVDSPESLAAAIVSQIKDGTKRTKGVYASRYALDNFTWKQQVARMVDVFEDARLAANKVARS